MVANSVLEATLVKDLSNHIYEKRKATAFQVETLTKQALARDDSRTIQRIIEELTDLTYYGSNSAKMGALTALGSVSVALGSFPIAYFLKDIVTPIFANFKDTDARVRYYASESLYNIAKISRGEILLYFNEVFDILCILVTDTESSVKNAADILDRLIKDIVSEKATNYVSILHEQQSSDIQSHFLDANGDSIQVSIEQDPHKAFSLPKFIPTLIERMSILDPFAKQFLIGWLELFDDIPSMNLIAFLPSLLGFLIKFLMNDCPSVVRAKTHRILDVFLQEIMAVRDSQRTAINTKSSLHQETLNHDITYLADEKMTKKNSSALEHVDSLRSGRKTPVDSDLVHNMDTLSIRSNNTTIINRRDRCNPEPRPNKLLANTFLESTLLEGPIVCINFSDILDILLSFLRIPVGADTTASTTMDANDLSKQPHEIYLEVKRVVLKWMEQILHQSPLTFVALLSDCVSVIVNNVSKADQDKDIELKNSLLSLNSKLQGLVGMLCNCKTHDQGDEGGTEIKNLSGLGFGRKAFDEFVENQLKPLVNKITTDYSHFSNELARITLLEWLIFLYSKDAQSFLHLAQEEESRLDLADLVYSCTEASNDVILKVLQLLSVLSESNQDFFRTFIVQFVALLGRDSNEKVSKDIAAVPISPTSSLPHDKVEFTVRKLCMSLSSERIFCTISDVLTGIDDCDFVGRIIVMLNKILLTAPEVAELRKKLRDLDQTKLEDYQLFSALFSSWCNNVPSAISLCLLTCSYELAYMLIKKISEVEVTFEFLTQIDILVQLFESPIFMKLRLQLLEPEKYPFLCKTLYGILMILPQSTTFTTLKNRLWLVSMVYPLPASFNLSQLIIPLASPLSTQVSSPVNPCGVSSLSIKRKRILEMADKFTKQQEKRVAQATGVELC